MLEEAGGALCALYWKKNRERPVVVMDAEQFFEMEQDWENAIRELEFHLQVARGEVLVE